MNQLVRCEWIAAVILILSLILSPVAGCSSSSGSPPVDAGPDVSTSGAPDTARVIDANCDPSLTYASFGMDFFATFCNRCHAWTHEGAQLNGSTIEDYAGTTTSMPPSAPFPTPDQRMQLVNWLDCGAP